MASSKWVDHLKGFFPDFQPLPMDGGKINANGE